MTIADAIRDLTELYVFTQAKIDAVEQRQRLPFETRWRLIEAYQREQEAIEMGIAALQRSPQPHE